MNLRTKPTASAVLICALAAWGCLQAGEHPAEAQGADASPTNPQGWVLVPSGEFDMGDHHDLGGREHRSDEVPIHTVRLDPFYMAATEVTNAEYCRFLNDAATARSIVVRDGFVYADDGSTLYCDTVDADPASSIRWDGQGFILVGKREGHPVVCVRWHGAAAFCNWLSEENGYKPCYDSATWNCDYSRDGFRLPTEAEWEYAALGGQHEPYCIFPWGDDPDETKANWPNCGDPYETGPFPWTTPVGFYNGALRAREDFGWPGTQAEYQTSDGANGYGLYDMSGNVWEWVNDWYRRDYYAMSPGANPTGPDSGQPMPDGKPYRVLRGGNWYNGEWGHGRSANRDPSYFRGPDDPNHRWYHIGFRVVRPGPGNTGNMDVGKASVKSAARTSSYDAGSSPQRREEGLRSSEDRPPRREEGPRPREGQRPRHGDKFQGTDSNGDGAVSLEEFLFHEEKKFNRIDADENGSVSSAEMAADERQQGKGPAPRGGRFERTDANRDGFVTLTEYLSAEKTKFFERDRNQDGNLSREELEAGQPGSRRPGAPRRDGAMQQGRGKARERETNARRSERRGPRRQHDRDSQRPSDSRQYAKNAQRPDRREEGRGSQRPPEPREGGRQRGGRQKTALDITALSEGKLGLVTNAVKAAPGYTLFAPKHRNMTYLIDNQGQKVHEWTNSQYEPGQTVYLLENGNLLRCCFTHARGFTRGGEGGRIEEYDWDDNLVWGFDYATDTHMLHHDIAVMPNGNILALAVERRGLEQCVEAGFDPALIRDGELYPDYVIEIEPTRPKGGRVVWEWHVWDHLIQERDSSKANYGRVAEHPERIDVNCNGRRVPAFWNHMNSIAYNEKLDQIVLSVRGCNEIWVIDHDTTTQEAAAKKGDLLYRWGNPAAYGQGGANSRQLFQQHDAHWIPEGHPGAGNILIFNNGLDRGYSSVEEIVPPVNASGDYAIAQGGTYGPANPIWTYTAPNETEFFSSEISGAHRLPNGNTLICAGVLGTFFEVTPAGKTVWKYVNPVVRGGILAQGEQPGVDDRGHYLNAVFKVHRYPKDFPGLVGKDLNALGPIELAASMKGETGLDKVNTQPERRQRNKEHSPDTAPRDDSVLRSLGYL